MYRRYFAIKIESIRFDSDPHPPCIEPSCIQFSLEFWKRGQKILPHGVALVWHSRWSSYLRYAVTRVAWNVTTDGRARSRRWLRHVVHSVLVDRNWIFNWHVRMSCEYVQVVRKMGGQAYTRRIYTTLTHSLTYSMKQTPFSEANRFSASQEIPCNLCNQKVHYRIHKCPSPVPILSQLDPVHTTTSHFLKIHLNIILPSMPGSPKWSPSLRCHHQNPVYASPFLPYTLHAPPSSFCSILSPERYLVRITDH